MAPAPDPFNAGSATLKTGGVKVIANTPSANASVRYVPRGLEIR